VEDETETAIPAASLSTCTLLLYDQKTQLASPGTTGAVINGRNRQSVLNANGGTIDASGNLEMVLTPADNVIVGTGENQSERHVALFEYTYGVGKAGKEEILIDVYNFARTT